jgi:hypothetical protein
LESRRLAFNSLAFQGRCHLMQYPAPLAANSEKARFLPDLSISQQI